MFEILVDKIRDKNKNHLTKSLPCLAIFLQFITVQSLSGFGQFGQFVPYPTITVGDGLHCGGRG